MPATIARFPDYLEDVKNLVNQHRKLRKGQLHLAVYLAPTTRPKRDIYLFEVLENFAGGRSDADKKLFTFAYGSTPGFPLPEGIRLWMILTNPVELAQAIEENWPRLNEVRKAKVAEQSRVLFADARGKRLWDQI